MSRLNRGDEREDFMADAHVHLRRAIERIKGLSVSLPPRDPQPVMFSVHSGIAKLRH